MLSCNDDLQQSSTSISPKTQPRILSREQDSHESQNDTLSQQDLEKLTEFLRSESHLWSAQFQPFLIPSGPLPSPFPFSENPSSLFGSPRTDEIGQILPQEQQHNESTCTDTAERQMRNYTVLSQLWYSCSAEITIGEQLDFIQFPVSYRELVYRWIALGRPQLQLLRTPVNTQGLTTTYVSGLPSPANGEFGEAFLDLQQVCEAQENHIIESIRTYMDNGYTAQPMDFADFASYLDVFSVVQAELACLENRIPKNTKNISRFYEETWWNCLQAFDLDRSICTAKPSHNCLKHFLWGEVYNWPLQTIIDGFQIFKNRSSSIKSILVTQFKKDMSMLMQRPSSSPSTLNISNELSSAVEDRERMIQSPSLPMDLSALGLAETEANVGFDSFNTSPSFGSYTSYWHRGQYSDLTFESPSTLSISTPVKSPLQNETSCDPNYLEDEENKAGTSHQTPHTFAITARPTTVSMPVTPLMRTGNCCHDLKRTSSSSSYKECDAVPHSQQHNNTSVDSVNYSTLVQDALDEFRKSNKPESIEIPSQPLLHILNQRRESTSSIGSSFRSENALVKVEEYRSLLEDAVAQLDTAARLFNLQTTQLQSPYCSRKHIRHVAAAARTLSTMSKTVRRARLTTSIKSQRPCRPRSQTTS